MLRIGLCDDEIKAREGMRFSLQRLIDEDEMDLLIYEFSSGENLLRWLDKHPGEMDILFLDIEMNEVDGMEAANRIRKRDRQLIIVFVTGYADHVFEGYEVNALDYLVKPVKIDKLERVIKRAMGTLNLASPETFTLQNTDGMYRVPHSDILFFFSDRRQVTLVSKYREYSFYAKLDEVANKFGKDFVRIHQRYLVNSAAVSRVEKNTVLVGDKSLPISRACRSEAMLAFAEAMLSGEKAL